MEKRSFTKALTYRLLSVIIGLLIGIAIAEIICRFHAFGWDAFNIKKVQSFVPIGYSGFIRPADDQYVWYELKPNLDDLFKMQKIKTNRQGLRDKEYAIEKPKNTFRVAVIGDSYTFGDGVSMEEAYHSVTETQLNLLSDSIQFEFINFGIAGYDLLNYLGVIEKKALEYNPDLILIGFCGNNDDDLPEKRQYTERFTKFKYTDYRFFIRNFQLVRTVANFIGMQKRKKNEINKNEKHFRKVAFVKDMFSQFNKIKKEYKTPILVYYLSMNDADPEKAKMINELCKKNNLEFVDSSPIVSKINDISEYWFHPTDHHPNAAMHQLYADILLKSFVSINLP